MTDEAHAGRSPAQAETQDTHGDLPRCAWPDGCAHTPPRAATGRPAAYCAQRVDGVVHNRSNAKRRRDELARAHSAPARAAEALAEDPVGEPQVDLAALTAGQQAQHIAALVDQLPQALADYTTTLTQASDLDAATRQVEAARRAAAAEVEAARRDAADAHDAEVEARSELAEEQAAREDADAATEAACAEAENARADADRARKDAEDARAEGERARHEAAEQIEQCRVDTENDARRVREDRDRILAEQTAAHATDMDELRARQTRELEAMRREAADADQARARAEQRAQDAEADAGRVRSDLDTARQDLADLRGELAQARAEHREELAAVRAEHRQELADQRRESATQFKELRSLLADVPNDEGQDEEGS